MSKITTTSYSGVDPGWFKVRRDLCRHLKGTAVEGGQLAGAEEHGQHEDGDHRGNRGGGSIHPHLAISPNPPLPQVAPELLIKSVTVVRTAKGSGHVLVTTADQVNNFADAQDSQILLEQKKAKS